MESTTGFMARTRIALVHISVGKFRYDSEIQNPRSGNAVGMSGSRGSNREARVSAYVDYQLTNMGSPLLSCSD